MANILLVDDDDVFREMLRIMLSRLGHTVIEESNGLMAWKRFQEETVDLVILDLIMPEQEGLETIQQFRRYGAKVKILAISGGGRLDARDILSFAEQFGADKTLAKPFTQEMLIAMLAEMLPPNKE